MDEGTAAFIIGGVCGAASIAYFFWSSKQTRDATHRAASTFGLIAGPVGDELTSLCDVPATQITGSITVFRGVVRGVEVIVASYGYQPNPDPESGRLWAATHVIAKRIAKPDARDENQEKARKQYLREGKGRAHVSVRSVGVMIVSPSALHIRRAIRSSVSLVLSLDARSLATLPLR